MPNQLSHYCHWKIDADKEKIIESLPFQLGAQKYFKMKGSKPGLRFGVYSPNARNVEVVFGLIWNISDPGKTRVDSRNPAQIDDLAGGYVADDGSGIDPDKPVIKMKRESNGCWFSDPDDPNLSDFFAWNHVPYMYRITKDNGRIAYRTDLYSRCQIGFGDFDPLGGVYEGLISNLSGTKSCSLVIDPDSVIDFSKQTLLENGKPVLLFPSTHFIPHDEFWKDEFDRSRPLPCKPEEIVIYQLHTAALGFGHGGVGTLDDAIELLDHLFELGVNAVELLPMSEYGGKSETWGYSTSHHFAIEFSGGGRDKFKYFVKAAHQRGIAVIFDVVYNHYAHEADRAEWLYDTDDHGKSVYYWYHGKPSDYPASFQGQGGYLDNISTGFAPRYDDALVAGLFKMSATSLMLAFHVDGFRADQTTSIHAYNVLHADGSPRPEANAAGGNFLREWCQTLKGLKPDVMLMAEDHSGWDAVTKPVAEGGLGFDAIWFADFHHHLNGANFGSNYAKLIPTAGYGTDDPLGLQMFSGVLCAAGPHTVVYHISHDEAGNSGHDDPDHSRRSHRTMVLAVRGVMNEKTRPYAEARSKVAFGLSVFSPGIPMFLFGEEVGFVNDFLYGNVLDYREDIYECRKTGGKYLFHFYRDAIRLRLNTPPLRSPNIEIVHVHDADRILAFRRFSGTDSLLVIASLNNAGFPGGYEFSHPSLLAGNWQPMLNSDLIIYGGRTNPETISQVASTKSGKLRLPVPANGLMVLKSIGVKK